MCWRGTHRHTAHGGHGMTVKSSPAAGATGAGPEGYVIEALVGRGASGSVHRAIQASTGRRVALKIVSGAIGETAAERLFSTERAALAELSSHPNVVSIVDAGVWDGTPWIAMEYYAAGAIAAPGVPLPVDEVLTVLAGVGSALAAAHRQGVLHCDVKPANVLRGDYGTPALGDFGIAKLTAGRGTSSGAINYTLDHVAPEVFSGAKPTAASDVYSLGTTIWELIEGRPPFRRPDDETPMAVVGRVLQEPVAPLSRTDVPGALTDLIGAMTDKDPAHRPDVAHVVAVAQAITSGRPIPSPSAAVPPPRTGSATTGSATTGSRTTGPPPRPSYPTGGSSWTTSATMGPPNPSATTGFAPPHVHPQGVVGYLGPPPGAAPRRSVVVPVLVVTLVLVLLAGGVGGFLWYRSTTRAVPIVSAGASSPVIAPAAAPTVAAPPAAPAPAVSSTGGSARTGGSASSGGSGPVAGSPPRATSPSASSSNGSGSSSTGATIQDVNLTGGNGSMGSDGVYHVSGSTVSFAVKVVDSAGGRPTSGCTAQVFAGGSPVGFVTCNSNKVSFSGNAGSTYTVYALARYNDRAVQSQQFYVTVDG